eukprot:2056919-Rhodomonas_salina.2
MPLSQCPFKIHNAPKSTAPFVNALFSVSTFQCPISNALFPTSHSQYPVLNAPFPMPHSQCPIPSAPFRPPDPSGPGCSVRAKQRDLTGGTRGYLQIQAKHRTDPARARGG